MISVLKNNLYVRLQVNYTSAVSFENKFIFFYFFNMLLIHRFRKINKKTCYKNSITIK